VRWATVGGSSPGFRCACRRPDCDRRLVLSEREWQEVRSRPNRFAVAREHVDSGVEAIVKEYQRFCIVEKQGEAGLLAAELA
jgi:hypothetical protein